LRQGRWRRLFRPWLRPPGTCRRLAAWRRLGRSNGAIPDQETMMMLSSGGAGFMPYLWPVLLLIASNVFMTFAWYGHLGYKDKPLAVVILASWGIALIEYCLAVPANRWGHGLYTAAELKTLQEVITLVVFSAFSFLWLKEPLGWNHAAGFALIAAGAFLVFQGRA
jgi:hypothetical protein